MVVVGVVLTVPSMRRNGRPTVVCHVWGDFSTRLLIVSVVEGSVGGIRSQHRRAADSVDGRLGFEGDLGTAELRVLPRISVREICE